MDRLAASQARLLVQADSLAQSVDEYVRHGKHRWDLKTAWEHYEQSRENYERELARVEKREASHPDRIHYVT